MELTIGIIMTIILLVIGVPVAFAFGGSLAYMTLALGYSPQMLLPYGFSKVNSVVLMAMPLFILCGGIMEKGGIGKSLVDLIEHFIGRIRGGLAAVEIVGSAIFGAITGSGAATLTCIGSIVSPRMTAKKYPKGITAAVVANAAPLGMLIPPSGMMILYAWSGQQSVLACFLATLVPGIILTVLQSIVSIFMLNSHKEIELTEKVSRREWGHQLGIKGRGALPALIMPAIILGGIYGGIFTAMEAAAVATLYAVPVTIFVYKGLDMKSLIKTIRSSCISIGEIFAMTITLNMICKIFILEDLPGAIMKILLSISDNTMVIMLMINIFMLFIGMIMDDVSSVLLCTPILLPVVTKLGISPIHFAAILGVNLGMGTVTPPCAPFLYMATNLVGAEFKDTLKPTVMLILFAWLPTLILTVLIPELSLTVPSMVLGMKFAG